MMRSEVQGKIKAAMLDAFHKRGQLERMFQHQLDDNLSTYVGDGGLDEVISKIIDEFDRKSRLDELVIAAIMANPTNNYLNDLANEINEIFPCSDNSIKTQNFSKYLLSILNDIEIDIFKNACFKAINSDRPEANIHKLDKLESFLTKLKETDYKKVQNKISVFLLKKLVFRDYPYQKDGNQTIVKVIQNLYSDKNLNEFIRNKLHNLVSGLNNSSGSDFTGSEEIYSYLLILINPQCEIHGYLIYDHKFQDNIDQINIELKQLEKNRKPLFFKQFKRAVDLFVNNALEMLVQNGIKSPSLTIEFFLPCDYLGENVDQYKFRHESSKRDFTIGYEHPVVVRSYERLKDARWNIKIQHGMKRLRQKRDSEIQEVFEHIHELDNITFQELTSRLEERIGLKLKCFLPEAPKKRKQLFEAILDSGLPIAIWTRDSKISNLDEIDEILSEISLKNLSTFSQSVWKKRKAAFSARMPEQCLGYHLALLCEYPELDQEFINIINSTKNYLRQE